MVEFDFLSGVYAAAVTPIDSNGSPAHEDIPEFLAFLATRGCHGALILGTTGEGPSFSPRERMKIMQSAVKIRQVHPEFRLLAGTGTPSLDETIQLTKSAFEIGYDGVVILPPYYYKRVSDQGLLAWFSQIIDKAVPEGGAVFGYHIPSLTGVPFTFEILESLRDNFPSKFIGIKDSSTDPKFAQMIGNHFGSGLKVYSGTDSLFSLALENEATGCITAMANLRSPDLRLVWDAYQHGDYDLNAQSRLEKSRTLMDRYPPNPPLYKALLAHLHGFPRWHVRPPLTPLTMEMEEKILAEALVKIDNFSS